MKVNRNGQAEVFRANEFNELIKYTPNEHHKLIFQIAYWTAARLGEVVRLPICCVYEEDGKVRRNVNFPSEITKDQETREVPISDALKALLERHRLLKLPKGFYLFPGKLPDTHLQFQSADDAMRRALKKAGLGGRGFSCHSFRRTAITRMASKGIAPSVIQKISGHENLANLQRYIEISEEQVVGAIATL